MKFLLSTLMVFLFVFTAFSQENKTKQKVFMLDKEVKVKVKMQYLIYLPENYSNNNKKYPLVLFLHGSGERGTDIEAVKRNGPPLLVSQGKEFPFILVSPQCLEDQRWTSVTLGLSALLDDIEANYRVDSNHVYVTGLSMGGQGTWALAMAEPARFAAIAPVCGWHDTYGICNIKDVPAWVFHGAKDDVVPVQKAEDVVNVLQGCGAKEVKLTVYPDANHNSWTATYNNEEFYKWLLSHSLNKKQE